MKRLIVLCLLFAGCDKKENAYPAKPLIIVSYDVVKLDILHMAIRYRAIDRNGNDFFVTEQYPQRWTLGDTLK